ncbi:hypothetical protein EVAR_99521_1 [Eumeta japonica]|uniref:Uncharacterized protein n=1 Tax=Eumeta variegata TaxID=151549 RepID=A0A4C1SE51_EUMVA|nr:hypothetical protein EVAR_99521_1 [Eumeta japonica]
MRVREIPVRISQKWISVGMGSIEPEKSLEYAQGMSCAPDNAEVHLIVVRASEPYSEHGPTRSWLIKNGTDEATIKQELDIGPIVLQRKVCPTNFHR